jgi:hypothetical protein
MTCRLSGLLESLSTDRLSFLLKRRSSRQRQIPIVDIRARCKCVSIVIRCLSRANYEHSLSQSVKCCTESRRSRRLSVTAITSKGFIFAVVAVNDSYCSRNCGTRLDHVTVNPALARRSRSSSSVFLRSEQNRQRSLAHCQLLMII